MRSRRFTSLLLALVLATAAPAAAAPEKVDERRELWRENLRLEAEVALAAKPKTYFVVDLGSGMLMLHVRGVRLAEMPIGAFGVWGLPPRADVRTLEGREPLSRPKIKPGEEQTVKNLDDRILELEDMPDAYLLQFAGEFEIRVMPAAEGPLGRIMAAARLLAWRLTRPLSTVYDRLAQRKSTSMYLVLRSRDARRLYWSLFEGIEGVVVPP